jgi:hypothetical protein
MGPRRYLPGQPEPDFGDLEIVGFDGTILPNVHCDESLPLVRSKSTGAYFLLSSQSTGSDAIQGESEIAIPTYSQDEIGHLVEEGRLTLLRTPAQAFKDAVVVYVSNELLLESGSKLTSTISGEVLKWQEQQTPDILAYVCPISRNNARRLMDSWAARLLASIDNSLVTMFLDQDFEIAASIERAAEMGLDAVRDPKLSERIYLRLGSTLLCQGSIEHLMNMYPAIQRDHPTWTKDSFLTQVTDTLEIMKARAQIAGDLSAARNSVQSSDAISIAEEALAYANLSNYYENDDLSERAFEAAKAYRESRGSSFINNDDRELVDFIAQHPWHTYIYLDDSDIMMLAAKPVFYYPGVISMGELRPIADLDALQEAYNVLGKESWNVAGGEKEEIASEKADG